MGRRGREGTVSTAPSTPQAPRPSSGWTVTTSLISFSGSLLSCPSCGLSGGIGCTAGRSSSAEDPIGSTTSVVVGTITADGGLERAALLTPHPISGRRACFEAVIDAQSKRKKPCPTSQAADAERPCRRVFSRLPLLEASSLTAARPLQTLAACACFGGEGGGCAACIEVVRQGPMRYLQCTVNRS